MKLIRNQSHLLISKLDFNTKARSWSKADKEKKNDTYKSANALYEGGELTLNAFKSRIFTKKKMQGKRLRILPPKQMLQR